MSSLIGRVSKAAQKIMPTSKRVMSRRSFVQGVMKQHELDRKNPLGQKSVGKRLMRRSAVAIASGQAMPGIAAQQRTVLDTAQRAHDVRTDISRSILVGRYKKTIESMKHLEEVKKTEQQKHEEQKKDETPVISKAEERRKEAKEKMRMWTLARERRQEADKKKAIRSLGLTAWQQSAISMGQAVKEKEEERKKKNEDLHAPNKAIDMPI